MIGTVEVAAPTATDLPDQAAIGAQAHAQEAIILRQVEDARAAGGNARSLDGPHDTSLWMVRAGPSLLTVFDMRVQVHEFLPRDSTVQTGDNVFWESLTPHTVTFIPSPPAPEWDILALGPDGTWRELRNPVVETPARPSAVYDPVQYFNSGNLNFASPRGSSWALTFEQPGSFEYFCAIHREFGMVGHITVIPR
jgi:plastocyanin